MTEDQYESVSRNIEILVRLTALSAVREMKQMDQISLLSAAGLQPKEIAELLGTTPNTVSVGLSVMKKKKGSKGKQ